MTLTDAHDLLDAVRNGMHASEAEITEALRETGDIGDIVIRSYRPAGTWESLLPSQMPADPFDVIRSVCGPRTLARIAREAA